MRHFIVASLVFTASSVPTAHAAKVTVVGLFPGKAVVVIDGAAPRTISVGQKTPEGVLLVSTTSDRALLEINGRKETLEIGQHFASPSGLGPSRVAIAPDSQGHHWIIGRVNGRSTRFLVDTGATTVNGGRLLFLNLDDLHSSGLAIASGATAEFQGSSQTFARFTNTSITGTGTFVKSGASLLTTGNVDGYARWNMTGGTIDVQGGEFRADYQDQALAWVNNKASMNVASGATVTMVGGNNITVDALSGNGTVQNVNNWGVGVFTIGSNNGSGTFTGTLRDNGGILALVKNGSGTQILSGANTYTGPTTVAAGTLLVNGTHATTGLINVSAGATFGGSGSVGPVTIANGGFLAPGNSAGAITVSELTLNPLSRVVFELGAPSLVQNPGSDFVAVGGTITLAGTLDITPIAGFGTPVGGEQWLLVTYGGGLADMGMSIGSAPALASGLAYVINTETPGQVLLTVVPEAGTPVLMLLGAILLRLRRP